jgi:hypothetical protein
MDVNKKQIIIGKKYDKKKNIASMPKDIFDFNKQISMINRLFLNELFDGSQQISKSLKCKINSYKTQDQKKNRYDKSTFISYNELIEKLVISKLKCYYCKISTLLMYENKRDPKQWTLDRIDNFVQHTNENTKICCLKCNLERRRQNDDKFKFTKQMRLIKKY